MSDLRAFLLARIAEDEEVAYGGAPSPWRHGNWNGEYDGAREVLDRHGEVTAATYYGGTHGHVLRFDPTRMLAECKAKREIVALYDDSAHPDLHADAWTLMKAVLAQLALPYAGHPDYQQRWRP